MKDLSGQRIIQKARNTEEESWQETQKVIFEKVLSEGTAAYATTILDIKRWWSDCLECDWYKSEDPILTEAIRSK